MTTGLRGVPSLDSLHGHNHETVSVLIARAQQQGTVRGDIVAEDLLFLLAALAKLVPLSAAVVPDAWRRYLTLLLDGLRTEAARPLPAPPLSMEEIGDVLEQMGS
jgi:hypothetical protein